MGIGGGGGGGGVFEGKALYFCGGGGAVFFFQSSGRLAVVKMYNFLQVVVLLKNAVKFLPAILAGNLNPGTSSTLPGLTGG